MTLYVKVPPNKGKNCCIFKFENAQMVKASTIEYTSITMYSDVRYNPWIPDNLINHRLPYNSFAQQTKNVTDIAIVVPDSGFRNTETVFCATVADYDVTIPLVDQMICFFYKTKAKRIKYQKIIHKVQDVPKELLLSLLGSEKHTLTRRELKLLGL